MSSEIESSDIEASHNIAVPIREFNFNQLADIYNRARVDYIVPMPMNGKRMEDYIRAYDISLDASLVAMDSQDQVPNGISMLGLRDTRSWITRLGVIPERRRRHTAEFLMRQHISDSQKRDCRLIQLEVIKGNEPAYRLFLKLGFVETRELLVIRRAPSKLIPELMPEENANFEMIDDQAHLLQMLRTRDDQPSWVEETASLQNAGNLRGLWLRLPEGEEGWLIFQKTPFQLTHFVFSTHASASLRRALLAQVHHIYSMMDTKIENIPAEHPTWASYQQFGYVEAFRRREMVLYL